MQAINPCVFIPKLYHYVEQNRTIALPLDILKKATIVASVAGVSYLAGCSIVVIAAMTAVSALAIAVLSIRASTSKIIKRTSEEPGPKPSNPTVIGNKPSNPIVIGNISIYSNKACLLRDMERFKFNQRLSDEMGAPLNFSLDDVALYLDGKFEKGDDVLHAKINPHGFFLPSSLFQDVVDGVSLEVRFRWDGDLIHFRCDYTFAEKVLFIRKNVEFRDSVGDFEVKKYFHDHALGRSLTKITFEDTDSIEKIDNFSFYEKDEKENGPYLRLESTKISNKILFDLSKDQIELSDVHWIQSTHSDNSTETWLLIPHKDNGRNSVEDITRIASTASISIQDHEGKTLRLNTNDFDPKKGHRRCWYNHGRYAVIRPGIPDGSKPYFYNNALTIDIEN